MNPAALLALISDLYAQAHDAQQLVEQLTARIQELEAAHNGKPTPVEEPIA